MKIEILGTGCPKCKKTYAIISEVVEELGVDATIEKIEDINDIVAKGVMITPAVMIDGVVKVEGKVPKKKEVEAFLKA